MTGIHNNPITTITAVAICPTLTKDFSEAPGLNFEYKSMVNKVEEALKTPARELINAANKPATTIPLIPEGKI